MSGWTATPQGLRNNCLTDGTQEPTAESINSAPWSEPHGITSEPRSAKRTDGPDVTDNNTSPVPATQRKLPIPHTCAKTNANLKAIIIKPKRILPAQPDAVKIKRPQEDASQLKSQVTEDENSKAEIKQLEAKKDTEISQKQTKLPKLHIDVERLKTYFLSHVNEVGTCVKKSVGNDSERGIKKAVMARKHMHCGYSPQSHFARENTVYSISPDGLSKFKEWCSHSEVNQMKSPDNKMATDNSFVKDHNIRSPSPKGSTTWDRSSSGYSSDERADPRSPPPRDSASVNSKQESTFEDDGFSVNESKCDKEESGVINIQEREGSVTSELSSRNMGERNTDSLNDDIGENTFVDKESGLNVCSCTTSEGANKLDQNQTTAHSKDDRATAVSNVSFVENSIVPKQPPRRPAWPIAAAPASGRIQYRKSSSESGISLRYPSRQGIDNSFNGLEVCGKSYSQMFSTTTKVEPFYGECTRTDFGAKAESNLSPSVLSTVEKVTTASSENLTELVPKTDINQQDSESIPKVMRKQFLSSRNPTDMKHLPLSLSDKLSIARDEKDIRKTLHDLSTPRRSPGGKSTPIRARHILNTATGNLPVGTTDTTLAQPVGMAFSSLQRINTNAENKKVVKFFGKKMWRPPQGQPENAQMRPFSPFGGTLPPSKIKENEQRLHDQDV